METISEKQKASFNKHTLTALMTVWKIPGTHELELNEEILRKSSAKEMELENVAKNYFVLSGRLNIFEKDKVRVNRDIRNGNNFGLDEDDEAVFETEAKWDIHKEV